MDYFIVVNGQKQGPFDIIGLIKKAKNGFLTAETMVSSSADGNFVPAAQVPELMDLLAEDNSTNNQQVSQGVGKLKLRKVLADGIDLWSRHVITLTLFAGIILAIGFGINKVAEKSIFLTQYRFLPNYILTFVTTYLYLILFYFILLAKRSQKPEASEIKAGLAKSAAPLLLASLIFACFTFTYSISVLVGHASLILVCLLLSFFIFTPFIVFDGEKKLSRALRLSFARTSKMGTDNFGVVMALVGANIILTFLPGIIMPDLFGFGLFISLPVTVAALAFVYDEIFG